MDRAIEELWYLIEHLGAPEKGYATKDFCDEFFRIYYSDEAVDMRDCLKGTELEKLANAVSRYSPYQEDLEKHPGVYTSDRDIETMVSNIKNNRLEFMKMLHVWIDITVQNDIDQLMETFGGFHDSCLTVLSYQSGAYVTQDLSMNPMNSDRILRMTFQRQMRNPMAVELEFIGLHRLTLLPFDENYTCEIHDISFDFHGTSVIFTDADSMDGNITDGFFVQAERARWRIADESLS